MKDKGRVNETVAGTHAPTLLVEVLEVYYREFKQQGSVGYYGIDSEINKYNHREMARQFAEVLDYGEKQI